MLILPLHRRLNAGNFPWMTMALILLNVCVYLFLQQGDARIAEHAIDYYRSVELDKIEVPGYLQWLRAQGKAREAGVLERYGRERDATIVRVLQADAEFQHALHADRIIVPDRADYADWRANRSEFDRLWDRQFTDRHELRFSEVDFGRMFSAMFLHAGIGHLLGNMLFLALLGLLVEGALGPALYLALYLLGGIGGQVASLAWRWGEHGAALGASGAIAALMGAYCVLWGLRKVRFFYWFFVVFDYIRAPALVLLPLWLGWEVLNLLFNKSAHIGFDAHAGGIVSGALLALGVRRLGWERRAFMAEDEQAEQRVGYSKRLQQALDHLGRLELAPALALLSELDRTEPGRLPVLVAMYRCARYGGKPDELQTAARRVFAFDAARGEEIRELKSIFDDYAKASAGKTTLAPAELLRLARLWQRVGAVGDAETLLRGVAARAPQAAGLPEAWFELAQREPDPAARWRERMTFVLERFPNSAVAAKARFLLEQM